MAWIGNVRDQVTRMVFVVLLLASLGVLPQVKTPDASLFVAEGGATYTFRDGAVELSAGPGWLRTPRLYLDFDLSFDIRSVTARSESAVFVRTWTGRDEWPKRGYRIALPPYGTGDSAPLLTGRRRSVKVLQQKTGTPASAEAWQHVDITGSGRQITVALGSAIVGVYEVERYGGHIIVEITSGQVQLRNVQLSSVERNMAARPTASPAPEFTPSTSRGPRLTHEVRPIYTPEAMKRGVQGLVELTGIVMPDGSIDAVQVTRTLDPDLDLAAIAAVREWRFKPGVRNGRVVPALVSVEVTSVF